MRLGWLSIFFAGLIASLPAGAAEYIQQGGNVTQGHVGSWTAPGILQDGGPATAGKVTELGITRNGGLPFCIYTGQTSPTVRLCFTVSSTDGATITMVNSGSPLPFNVNYNGVISPFSIPVPVSLANGGTGVALTANNGGIVYSNASTLAILSGTSTAGLPLISGSNAVPSWGSRSGNTTTFATSTGTLTNGNCVSINAGNFIDAGGPCTTGGGGGTVSAGTAGQLTYYAGSGTVVAGNANATISSGALTLGQASSVAGSLILNGSGSGHATIVAQAAASTPTLTLPTGSGTFASSASAPLSLSATTGALTISSATSGALGVVQGDGSTLTITAGVISCTTATTSQIGCVKPDGTSVTISGGIISSVNTSGPVLLATLTASTSASLTDTTHITSSYKSYEFRVINLLPVNANATLQMQLSTNAGVSYDSTLGNYWINNANSMACPSAEIDTSNSLPLGGMNSIMKLYTPSTNGTYKMLYTAAVAAFTSSDVLRDEVGCMYVGSTSPVNAIKFIEDSGSISSGVIEIWGYP